MIPNSRVIVAILFLAATTETVRSFDAAGNLTASPATPAQLIGKRVTLP